MRSPENSSFHGNTSSASIEHCLNTEHRLDGQNDRAVTDRRHLTERCAPVENCPAIKFTLSIASRARGKIKRRANKSDLRWSGEVRPLVMPAVLRFVTKLGLLAQFISACQFLPDINCVVAAKEEFPAASAEEKRRST